MPGIMCRCCGKRWPEKRGFCEQCREDLNQVWKERRHEFMEAAVDLVRSHVNPVYPSPAESMAQCTPIWGENTSLEEYELASAIEYRCWLAPGDGLLVHVPGSHACEDIIFDCTGRLLGASVTRAVEPDHLLVVGLERRQGRPRGAWEFLAGLAGVPAEDELKRQMEEAAAMQSPPPQRAEASP